jgi:hypothetical protein
MVAEKGLGRAELDGIQMRGDYGGSLRNRN